MTGTPEPAGPKDSCDRCGRKYPPLLLESGRETGTMVCPDCAAEENECGCSDDQ